MGEVVLRREAAYRTPRPYIEKRTKYSRSMEKRNTAHGSSIRTRFYWIKKASRLVPNPNPNRAETLTKRVGEMKK